MTLHVRNWTGYGMHYECVKGPELSNAEHTQPDVFRGQELNHGSYRKRADPEL
jgi:hypothetical protein